MCVIDVALTQHVARTEATDRAARMGFLAKYNRALQVLHETGRPELPHHAAVVRRLLVLGLDPCRAVEVLVHCDEHGSAECAPHLEPAWVPDVEALLPDAWDESEWEGVAVALGAGPEF